MSLPVTDVVISWADQKATRRPGKFDNNLNNCFNYSRFKTLKRTKPNQKRIKIQNITKTWVDSCREGKKGREISEDNRDNQQSYSIAFFDQHCCLSSKNSFSNLFSQYKISLCWRNTKDVSSFTALAKTVFDTDSDMKVHALHYAN